MDAVISNQENNVAEIIPVSGNIDQEVYTGIINNVSYSTLLKHEPVYPNEEQDATVSTADYQSSQQSLKFCDEFDKCHHQQKMNYYINGNEDFNHIIDKVSRDSVNDNENVTETGHISFKTTDDESMAVEALRQLGGMYPHVVTTEQTLPMLPCSVCSMKFHTTSDLRVHTITCRAQFFQNFNCAVCNVEFNNEQNYNNHKCIMTKLPCKYCYTYFTTRIELEKHIQVNHNTSRPYKCHFCNMAFPRSSSLANHSKIHNYLPGRALITNANKVVGPDPTNISTWTFESVYVPENAANISSTDSLSNWNLDYVANPLMQAETNDELSTTAQEIIVTNDLAQHSIIENNITEKGSDKKKCDSLDFQIPVKIEVIPYVSDIEKCLDDSFPITSMPQMEVTIGTDNKKPHVCTTCGMDFSKEKALNSHIKRHSMGLLSGYECGNCAETFPDQKTLSQHKKSCGIVLNQTYEQNVNVQIQNKKAGPAKIVEKTVNLTKPQVKVGKHPCPDCDKHFTTKQKMFRHLWIHRKKTFTCELCAMTFAVQAELDKHRLSQHPADSPYVCNECGKCFASRQGLWEHGRVHGGGSAGLFTCNKCSKTFASRQGFLIHHRTHTDERPYGCRFCLKAFRDGGTLRKHERIHTGYRPYVCPICSHDFNQKVVLREHVRWVHVANKTENDSGMFVCQICNGSVSDKEELCAHIVKHSDLLTLEAKNNLKDSNNQNYTKVSNRVRKKIVQPKTNNAGKVDSVSQEKIVTPKEEQLDLNSGDYNLIQYDFTEDQNNVECDLCGNKFLSQKELMTHVHIHI